MSRTLELINNKRNIRKFIIYDTYECGLVLNGLSVKKILNHQVNLNSAHAWFKGREIFLRNFVDQETQSDIKLLLNKKEIIRIRQLVKEKKYLLIPTKIYLKNYKIKVEIALSKLNKEFNNKEKLNKLKEKGWKELQIRD